MKKIKTTRWILLAILFAAFGTAAVVFGVLYYRSWQNSSRAAQELAQVKRSLANATETIRALQGRVSYVPGSVVPPPESESTAGNTVLSSLSTSTHDALLGWAFPEKNFKAVKEISPGVVAAVIAPGDSDLSPSVAWQIDTNTRTMRELFGIADTACQGLSLRDWVGGFAVDHFSSPCEAVRKQHSYYYNKNAALVAETEHGNFGRSGDTLDASIGTVKLTAAIMQGSPCVTPEGNDWHTPTTTIIGVKVNGRSAKLPAPIGVECNAAYGETFSDYQFPAPSFDGKYITFRLPGYDAAINSSGVVMYTARTAYVIPYRSQLIREDQTGSHEVRASFETDPIFDGYLRTSKEDPVYHFEVKSFDGRIVTIKIYRFHYPTQRDVDTGMTVEYDTKTDTFQNLVTS